MWVTKLNSSSPNELSMLFIADLSLQPSKFFFFLFNWFFCLKLSSVEWGVWSFLILLCCDYVSLWSLMLLCIFHLSNIIYSYKFIIFNNYLVWFGWDNNFLCSPDEPWIHIVSASASLVQEIYVHTTLTSFTIVKTSWESTSFYVDLFLLRS